MAVGVVGRVSELQAIERLLGALDEGPAALVFEGEPGIGKTTLVLASVEAARTRGVRVLFCTGSSSEARLSYAALADLLREVDEDIVGTLPPPQRDALDAALLRARPGDAAIDPLAVATATLSVVDGLVADRPVLVAIDDLQWLDPPTARVIEFCARRLSGSVGLLAARRAGAGNGDGRPPIALREPDRTEVRHLESLTPGDLTQLLRERSPQPVERSALARIREASGGNPFYAIELSRVLPTGAAPAPALPLPASLEEVVAANTSGLEPLLDEALLAVASLAAPTRGLLEEALGPGIRTLLEQAEELDLVSVDGDCVRFTHPLLAHGIYARASAPRRRATHRRLAAAVSDPEERARHLAHARVLPDAIDALDEAARYVRARGAPDAAAELLELALELGGDSELLVRAAEHHFDASEPGRAKELAERALEALEDREARAEALLLLGEIGFHAGDYAEGWTLLERAQAEAGSIDRLRVAIAVPLTHVLFQLGRWDETAETARSALAAARRLDEPGLVAQTLGVTLLAEFNLGHALDEPRLAEALRLEDPKLRTGIAGASLLAFLLYLWTARFEEAREALDTHCQRVADRGEEPALAWAATVRAQLESWSGNLADARAAANEAAERGLLEMGTTGRALGLWGRSLVDAYTGRADDARRDAEESMALFERTGSRSFPIWPLTTLGFLELSVGDYEAAASRLAPAAANAISAGLREPAADGGLFTGDAAEALVAVGRIEEAEPIVSLLEERGAALDRTWAIAVGARCRGLILAAQGEVGAAERALDRALVAHDGLPMPIERARSLLALGRIRRRLRKRRAAKAALDEAVAVFERVGSPRWAERAREEIAAIGLRVGAGDELTPAEARVARLAATGLTNKEVATKLVLSPKTVEAHLGRAYRKLGIRRRAELGARMAQHAER
jgi:DNA-binding CsgD family transcriptional regulator